MNSVNAGLPAGPRRPTPLWRWLAGWGRLAWLQAALLALALSPSSWQPRVREALARQLVLDTAPILLGFTALAALLTLVITRIVVVTASSYGLSQYALEMVIRVLVLELLPLTACLFVALRTTIPSGAALARIRQAQERDGPPRQAHADADAGDDAGGRSWDAEGLPVPLVVLREALPRLVAGLFACVTLAALSCVVATVLAYLAVYGPSWAGLEPFTRVFGRIFDGTVTLILVLKTALFALAVSVIPMASALQDLQTRGSRESAALQGLVRMFAVLLVLEAVSLVGNYY